MTTALWMLYLADVSAGISLILGAFGLIGAVVLLCWWSVSLLDPMEEVRRPPIKPMLKVILPALLIAAVLPSKTTLYAIAAYSLGDEALHTQTGEKAVRALNAWLDRQIAGDEK